MPCPEGALKGCYQAYTDMQASISSTSNGFLGGSIAAYVLIAVIAAYLGFTGDERKPVDEESNNANNGAIVKEDARKTEVESPI